MNFGWLPSTFPKAKRGSLRLGVGSKNKEYNTMIKLDDVAELITDRINEIDATMKECGKIPLMEERRNELMKLVYELYNIRTYCLEVYSDKQI